VQDVLDGERHAGEGGRRRPGGQGGVETPGGVDRAVGGDDEEGVDAGLHRGDAVEVRPRHLLA
jgi:hypothetical protein